MSLDWLRVGWVGWQRTCWKVRKVVRLVGVCSMMRGWLVVDSCWRRWMVDFSWMRLWSWWMVRLNSRKMAGLNAWWICWEMSEYLRLWLRGVVNWRALVMGLRAWLREW